MELLTNAAVEEKVLRRVRAKASTYGQDIEDLLSAPVVGVTAAGGVARKVDPETIVALYRDFVIPLTKEVEVLYLFERLSGCAVVFVDARGRRAAEAHFAARLPPDATVPTGVRAPPVSYVPRSSVQAVLSDVVCGKARYGIVPLSVASGVLDVSTFHRLSVSKLRVCADVLLYDDQLVIAAMKPGPPAVVHGSLSRLQQVSATSFFYFFFLFLSIAAALFKPAAVRDCSRGVFVNSYLWGQMCY
ncbi:hypothetical protein T492DRAFT_461869 [Pavlovales sp. CCMP2436]|nr:hypothetical protein T492DRAFT_461869 [Pavlovales sp. CCMP2436]